MYLFELEQFKRQVFAVIILNHKGGSGWCLSNLGKTCFEETHQDASGPQKNPE